MPTKKENKEILKTIKKINEQNLNILKMLTRTPIDEEFLKQKARENFEKIKELEERKYL